MVDKVRAEIKHGLKQLLKLFLLLRAKSVTEPQLSLTKVCHQGGIGALFPDIAKISPVLCFVTVVSPFPEVTS